MSLFNPNVLDIKLVEEILFDGETIRESYIEPKSCYRKYVEAGYK